MANILFISPIFFDYQIRLTKEMESQGHNVFWYSDRPKNNFFSKSLIRLNKNLLKRKTNKYIDKIIEEIADKKIDYVLVIFGQSFSKDNILKLRKQFKSAKFVYYTWDAVENFAVIKELYPLFDNYYSFDKKDCKKYGFKFLPLFYSNDYIENEYEYDFTLITTVKAGKLSNIKKILNMIPIDAKVYKHLYIQSKLVYLYYKIKLKEFKGTKMKDFKYYTLKQDEVNDILSKSKVVIDIQMGKQNGLTMRTFETLHLNKKLITSNQNIKQYDFYSSNNILCLEDIKETVDSNFYNETFDLNNKLDSKYSIASFVKQLLK